jgi:hypothetical protein
MRGCCIKPVIEKQPAEKLDLGDTSRLPNPENGSVRLDFSEMMMVIFASCIFVLTPDEMP